MNKIREACRVEGKHTIFINSKTPITLAQIKSNIYVPEGVKIHLEGPRVLWDDVKGFPEVHIGIFIFTCGASLLGYLGFWMYEKWKPLYIVTLNVQVPSNLSTRRYSTNPLMEITIK